MYPQWFCGAGGKQANNNADGEKQVFFVHMAHYSLGCGSGRYEMWSLSRLYILPQV